MFMQIAIGAIGVGIVIMVGYLVIAQVSRALPVATAYITNPCRNHDLGSAYCNTTANTTQTAYRVCTTPITDNTSGQLLCNDSSYISSVQGLTVTIGAGLGLIAVGIIVLAAFGLIQIFQ